MSRKLTRTVVLNGVLYPVGTAATKELEGAITNPNVWDVDAAGTDGVEGDGSGAAHGYDAQTGRELKAEIDRRNEGREEDARISKTGNKADLVAALEADDQAAAEPDNGADGRDADADSETTGSDGDGAGGS